MMKGRNRITTILAILFLLTPTILAITVTAGGMQILVVDKNGSGDYTSIQEAVNNAKSGSTIFIKNGEYPEIIDIRKSINLVGEDKAYTIINPISEKNKNAIRLGAPQSSLSSITIINGAPGLYSAGVKITSSNTIIDDCNIYDTPVGIAIWTSDNTIKNCEFRGCKDEGIALLGSEYSDCNNNKILNCVFYDNCDGIELQYSSGNTITDCVFYDNTHTGIDAIAKSNDNNIISNCKIYNNRVHGIYFSASSENQIIDCEISDNQDGNIVNNKFSENNQVINTEETENVIRNLKLRIFELFQNILSRISKLKNNQIFTRFSEYSF
jgi:parallel beta-helix repeat protein